MTDDGEVLIIRWCHDSKAWLIITPNKATKLYWNRIQEVVGRSPFIVRTVEEDVLISDNKIFAENLK